MSKILIFVPSYNEAENIESLLETIFATVPHADILTIDDASPDGTGRILDRLCDRFSQLRVIHRPRKLGLGTAHKLAMHDAIANGYDRLITMDADFSHHPKYLPEIITLLDRYQFVTGSRYTRGGRCDYGLYRSVISRGANIVARMALGLPLKENTTAYRGFRVSLLKRINLDQIRSEGYSFFVESLFRVSKLTSEITEFPIHFENRRGGKSKISKSEIFKAGWTIFRLVVQRLASHLPLYHDPRAGFRPYQLRAATAVAATTPKFTLPKATVPRLATPMNS